MEKKLTIENTRGIVDPCVYVLTAPHGRIYVGSALNGFHERSSKYRNGKAHGTLQKALKKYGAVNFTFSILESSSEWQKGKLQEREQYYLDALQPFAKRGYNIERVAGIVEPMKRRVSQFTSTGEPVASYESITWASVMARACLSSISACCTGKRPNAGGFIWLYSEEVTPQGIARSVRIAASVTTGAPRRCVNQYSKAGEFVASFKGIREAAHATGGYNSSIIQCCRGEKLSAGGYLWLYPEEVTPQEVALRVERAASAQDSKPRRVNQYSKAGEFITSYPSASEAARATSGYISSISKCANGKQKSAGGFIWRYTKEKPHAT